MTTKIIQCFFYRLTYFGIIDKNCLELNICINTSTTIRVITNLLLFIPCLSCIIYVSYDIGNTFEYFLEKGVIQSHITILGATSGDTGSAALHGLRGKKNVNCFIMYPKGKVTDIQERQMTSILDDNVHCISIDVSISITQF